MVSFSIDTLSIIFSFLPLADRIKISKTNSIFVQATERSNVSNNSLAKFKKARRAELFERNLDELNWKKLSSDVLLPTEFFRKHEDKLDWEKLSSNPSIPIDLLEKHIEELDLYLLTQNTTIPIEFFEKYQNKYQNRYKSDLWQHVIAHRTFDPELFEKHFNLEALCRNPYITIDILEKYAVRAGGLSDQCYSNLSSNNSIPIEYIPKSKIHWNSLFTDRRLTTEWLEAIFEQLDEYDWEEISMSPNAPIEFIERHLDKFDWYCLVHNTGLPEEFFERHINELLADLKALSVLEYNNYISIEFFEKYTEFVDWQVVLASSKLSRDFLERHLEDLDWAAVSRNTSVPIMFLEDHIEKIHWNKLSSKFGLRSPGVKKYWNKRPVSHL